MTANILNKLTITSLRKFAFCCAAALAANTSMLVNEAEPAQGNVIFGGNLTTNNACWIIVRQPGDLGTNASNTMLSSRIPGGQSGIADVFAIFPYDVSVDTPPYFTNRPLGGDDNVTFQTFFSGQALNPRGSTFPSQPGNNPVTLSSFFSYTRLTVDLEASRPDPFPTGNYSTYAIVRCE